MKLVYLRADWCGVCTEKSPLVREIAAARGLPLEVVDWETEEGKARAAELRLKTVPTLALVDGARVPFRLVGSMITAENVERLAAATSVRREEG